MRPLPAGYLILDLPAEADYWSVDCRGMAPPTQPGPQVFTHTFTLYRMTGPEPLWHWWADMECPANGKPQAWNLFQGYIKDHPESGDAATWTGPVELTVTTWRDPAAPPRIHERLQDVLPPGHWWCEIACPRGGLAPDDHEPDLLAPADGYVEKIRWDFDPAAHTFADQFSKRLFWRRNGTPVRYGVISLTLDWNSLRMATDLGLKLWLNPTGSRLLERPMNLGQEADWVEEITRDQRLALSAEPADAGAPKKLP